MKKENVRNIYHVIVGILLAYILFQTFEGIELFFQLVLTSIVVTVIGGFWEIGWNLINKSEVDGKDVVRALVSALITNIILFLR